MKQKEIIVLVDPPEGWMYGFPKVLPAFKSLEEELRWFVDSGYPQELIDRGMLNHCRYFQTEAEILDDA